VTIQNASDGVSDRARCGHHRDRALLGARPGPLEQARQFHKNSRRIALGSRRFAGGNPNLALRHREAGDGIHQHQHVLAEIAEILGNGATTERARPAAPRSSCKNSWTSRPRSPTSLITEMSAETLRASINLPLGLLA
jgi:hypothetical protein